MEKGNNAISSRTLLLLAGALVLNLLAVIGAVGATQAAQPQFASEEYQAYIEQTHLGVALVEKTGDAEEVVVNYGYEAENLGAGSSLDNGALLSDVQALLDEDKKMLPGKPYAEKLYAQNVSSDMSEYVRMTIRKHFADADGNKRYDIDPKLIELGICDDGWVKSEGESNDEKLVFYYDPMLGVNSKTSAVIDSIRLDPAVKDMDEFKTSEGEDSKVKIVLSAEVDAVQTKHVADAAKSAWGVDVDSLGLSWGKGA